MRKRKKYSPIQKPRPLHLERIMNLKRWTGILLICAAAFMALALFVMWGLPVLFPPEDPEDSLPQMCIRDRLWKGHSPTMFLPRRFRLTYEETMSVMSQRDFKSCIKDSGNGIPPPPFVTAGAMPLGLRAKLGAKRPDFCPHSIISVSYTHLESYRQQDDGA